MKIVYVANFDQPNSNDDEGAILYALRALGHEVSPLREKIGHQVNRLPMEGVDFLLCHHWADFSALRTVKVPKVFWCFDLIDWPQDSTLARRSELRVQWINVLTDVCDLGFMSDGDWVADDKSGKLHVLRQGADERVVGRGDPQTKCETCGHVEATGRTWDVAMFGIAKGGGIQRESFVKELKDRYGERFLHVEHSVHGRKLADLVSRCKVVVAPDSPVTDRYWSNRVYVMLGFGACLLHPRCNGLRQQYRMAEDYFVYDNRKVLHEMLEMLLAAPKVRSNVETSGLQRTQALHLYRHRCEQLIKIVKEKLC